MKHNTSGNSLSPGFEIILKRPSHSRAEGIMQSAQAELHVITNGNGTTEIHTSNPPNIGLVDSRGAAVQSNRPLMVRVDAKAREPVTLSRGTVWIIAIAPVFITLMIVIGGLLIGFGRTEQATSEKQMQMQSDITDLKANVKTIMDTLQEQAVQNAKVQGYQLGVTDAHNAPKQKKKGE